MHKISIMQTPPIATCADDAILHIPLGKHVQIVQIAQLSVGDSKANNVWPRGSWRVVLRYSHWPRLCGGPLIGIIKNYRKASQPRFSPVLGPGWGRSHG